MRKNLSDQLNSPENLLRDYGVHFSILLLFYRKNKFSKVLKMIKENPTPIVIKHFANEPDREKVKEMLKEEKVRVSKLNKLAKLLNEEETEEGFRKILIEANKVIYGEDSQSPF